PENSATALYDDNSVIKKRSLFSTKMMSGAIELALNTTIIQQDKRKIRNASLMVSGVVFVFGILLGFWLSRSISVPVLALRDAADKVGKGDLSQRVVNESGDEIGELSRAFNKMVTDLERASEERNKANNDLAAANDALNQTVSDLKATQDQLIQAEKMASL